MTSRTSTPVERGALQAAEVACGRRGSRDLLPGEQHEHVLEVGRAALALRRVAVGALDAEHARRTCRCGACGSPRRAPRASTSASRARRPVDLDRVAAGVLGDQLARAGRVATAVPSAMIVTVSARRSASSM